MFFPYGNDIYRVRSAVVNHVLIGINVVVHFWLLAQSPESADSIYSWTLLVPAELSSGTLHTLLTSMFLHADLVHLGGNMLFLWIVGNAVEDRLGHGGYLAAYLLCGLAAGLGHVVTTTEPGIPTLGASGAISGVLGLYAAFYPDSRIKFLFWIGYLVGRISVRAIWAIAAWFALQLLDWAATIGDPTAEVAYGAHVGGFLLGLILAVVIERARPVAPADDGRPGRPLPSPPRPGRGVVPALGISGLAIAGGAFLWSSGLLVPPEEDAASTAANGSPVESPESVARSVHEDLRRGEFDRVHARLSASLRRSLGRDGLERLVAAEGEAFAAGLDGVQVSVEGSTARVHGSVTAATRVSILRYGMVEEGGAWAVDAIEVTGFAPLPADPAPPEREVEPAEAVVRRLLDALGRGDLDVAYACGSKRFRASTDRAAFERLVAPIARVPGGPRLEDVAAMPGGALVRARDDASRLEATFGVVREGPGWAVDSVSLEVRPAPADPPVRSGPPRCPPRRGTPALAGPISVRLAPEPGHPSRLAIEFEVRDFGIDEGGACRLAVDLAILDPGGASVVDRNRFETIHREFLARDAIQVRWTLRADLPGRPAAGPYEIWLVVRDEVSGTKVQGRTSVRIGP